MRIVFIYFYEILQCTDRGQFTKIKKKTYPKETSFFYNNQPLTYLGFIQNQPSKQIKVNRKFLNHFAIDKVGVMGNKIT